MDNFDMECSIVTKKSTSMDRSNKHDKNSSQVPFLYKDNPFKNWPIHTGKWGNMQLKEGNLSCGKGKSNMTMDTVNINLMAQQIDSKLNRILVICIAYYYQLVNQLNTNPDILKLCQCVGPNNRVIDTSISGDTFCCIKIEEEYPKLECTPQIFLRTIL